MNCCNFGGEKMTESEYFKSNKFKEDFRKKVEEVLPESKTSF